MQYRTTCNNCGREYMVDGTPGQTIHAKCPYCGALANVLTPTTSADAAGTVAPPNEAPINTFKKRKSDKPLFLRVTMWFLIIVTILFVLLTILYFVFTGMSH